VSECSACGFLIGNEVATCRFCGHVVGSLARPDPVTRVEAVPHVAPSADRVRRRRRLALPVGLVAAVVAAAAVMVSPQQTSDVAVSSEPANVSSGRSAGTSDAGVGPTASDAGNEPGLTQDTPASAHLGACSGSAPDASGCEDIQSIGAPPIGVTAQLRTWTSPDGSYSVEFPSEPTVEVQAEGDRRVETAVASDGVGITYAVIHIVRPDMVSDLEDTRAGIQDSLTEQNANNVVISPWTQISPSVWSMDAYGELNGAPAWFRTVVSGTSYFSIAVGVQSVEVPRDTQPEQAAQRFLASFQILT
jgi:hypothetical protein